MDFKLVLLVAFCCTLIAAKPVDRPDEATEEPPQLRKAVKREEHGVAFHVEDKEDKNAYSVQNQEDGPKQSALIKKRSSGDDEKSKSGCCG